MYHNFLNLFKKTLILTVFISLLVGVFELYSQDLNVVDSLKKALAQQKGIAQFEPLLELTFAYADKDNETSIDTLTKLIGLAITLGDSAKIVKAGRLKGQLLRRLDRLNEATNIFLELLPIAKRNNFRNDYKIILNSLALVYTFQAEYDKAFDYNFQSLVLREHDGDKKEISVTLNNIGFAYFKLKNYERAIEYYNKSLKLKKEVNDSFDLDALLINIGLCYNYLQNYSEAQRYIYQGLSTCGDNCTNQIKLDGEFGLGVAMFNSEKTASSEQHFLLSYELSKAVNDKRFQAENLIYLGRIQLKQKNYPKAEGYLYQAEQLAATAGYNQILLETYRHFSALYDESNDFKNATLYQRKYIQLNDSIYNRDLIKNLAKVQADFEERENIATIAAKELVIKQQRDLNFAIAIIAILAGLLILVLQRGNRNIKQVNAKLSEAKETIQEQNRLLEGKNKDLDRQVAEKDRRPRTRKPVAQTGERRAR